MLGGAGADLPAAHIPTLLQAMRDGVPYPVKAFLVFGNNTLTTYGNARQAYEALMKVDLLVVADLFMTPTAELADIVLPAAAWPELNQIAGLPTVAANADAWHNYGENERLLSFGLWRMPIARYGLKHAQTIALCIDERDVLPNPRYLHRFTEDRAARVTHPCKSTP
jgi:hypothetical protein